MVQFMTLPLFIFTVALLSETLCSLTLDAEVGDKVTIWCQHDLSITGSIFWFKHKSDSVPLLLGCKKFRASGSSPVCYFFTESERIVMSVHGKNTSLTITAVNVSDTGLYYCSFGDEMVFSNSTCLQVGDGNKTNQVKEKGCISPAVFLMLTGGFGTVIIILLSVFIIKDRKTHRDDNTNRHDEEEQKSDSVNYAALHYIKTTIGRSGRHGDVEETHVVYSAIRQ